MANQSIQPVSVGQSGMLRQPRGLVQINGNLIPGAIDFEVDSNAFREADTFRVTFALSLLVAPYDEAWIASQTTMSVNLYAGFPSDPLNFGIADLDLILSGHVDDVNYQLSRRTLELSGRDLTSLFIDAKTAEKWQNQTSSEIATTLATRHGLTPVVTKPTESVGKFYQIDHTISTTAQTEWDLLCWLAQQEQFVVYVKGNSLYFQPPPDPSTAPKYPIVWQPATSQQSFQSNTVDLDFSRTLTVGKTITVQVRTWNQKKRAGFTVSYPSSKGSQILVGKATAPAQLYSYRIPNLTQAQAQTRAQALYNELIRNEMRLNATIPADNVLDILHVMPVSGTGTAFDQTYYPQSINRRLSMDGGYTMTIMARNHSDAVQPVEAAA